MSGEPFTSTNDLDLNLGSFHGIVLSGTHPSEAISSEFTANSLSEINDNDVNDYADINDFIDATGIPTLEEIDSNGNAIMEPTATASDEEPEKRGGSHATRGQKIQNGYLYQHAWFQSIRSAEAAQIATASAVTISSSSTSEQESSSSPPTPPMISTTEAEGIAGANALARAAMAADSIRLWTGIGLMNAVDTNAGDPPPEAPATINDTTSDSVEVGNYAFSDDGFMNQHPYDYTRSSDRIYYSDSSLDRGSCRYQDSFDRRNTSPSKRTRCSGHFPFTDCFCDGSPFSSCSELDYHPNTNGTPAFIRVGPNYPNDTRPMYTRDERGMYVEICEFANSFNRSYSRQFQVFHEGDPILGQDSTVESVMCDEERYPRRSEEDHLDSLVATTSEEETVDAMASTANNPAAVIVHSSTPAQVVKRSNGIDYRPTLVELIRSATSQLNISTDPAWRRDVSANSCSDALTGALQLWSGLLEHWDYLVSANDILVRAVDLANADSTANGGAVVVVEDGTGATGETPTTTTTTNEGAGAGTSASASASAAADRQDESGSEDSSRVCNRCRLCLNRVRCCCPRTDQNSNTESCADAAEAETEDASRERHIDAGGVWWQATKADRLAMLEPRDESTIMSVSAASGVGPVSATVSSTSSSETSSVTSSEARHRQCLEGNCEHGLTSSPSSNTDASVSGASGSGSDVFILEQDTVEIIDVVDIVTVPAVDPCTIPNAGQNYVDLVDETSSSADNSPPTTVVNAQTGFRGSRGSRGFRGSRGSRYANPQPSRSFANMTRIEKIDDPSSIRPTSSADSSISIVTDTTAGNVEAMDENENCVQGAGANKSSNSGANKSSDLDTSIVETMHAGVSHIGLYGHPKQTREQTEQNIQSWMSTDTLLADRPRSAARPQHQPDASIQTWTTTNSGARQREKLPQRAAGIKAKAAIRSSLVSDRDQRDGSFTSTRPDTPRRSRQSFQDRAPLAFPTPLLPNTTTPIRAQMNQMGHFAPMAHFRPTTTTNPRRSQLRPSYRRVSTGTPGHYLDNPREASSRTSILAAPGTSRPMIFREFIPAETAPEPEIIELEQEVVTIPVIEQEVVTIPVIEPVVDPAAVPEVVVVTSTDSETEMSTPAPCFFPGCNCKDR